ncbi:MAG: sulfite exporter TauE/SafE family protein [Acidobacteria bacterium]|nr:MAG: sulfite exporter TauE/SafE family protein [Acidobacteriota bacterium]REK03158.1 MAG: sulfite exporter TauE/SafE family protein [Acidobacteriota bacterium]REK15388.1 MAG: sulfite exporter TauE/SafE family protein [Acidobacteriota bacterium]REK42107.1 MAG: sulfite exporter TauE/SafE family protein [Acidobacteriota bacterium]
MLALVVLFFVTAAIGVVTGSNSLITVPVMFQFGIEPKVAIATNMFGLTFMNIGASVSFIRSGKIDYGRLSPLVLITLAASAIGAFLVGQFSSGAVPVFVTVSMLFVVGFTLFKRESGIGGKNKEDVPEGSIRIALLLTFLLGVYGGMYSGGYVTMLTAVLVGFYGLSFTEAVAGTKFINVFSSAIATVVFAWQGLIDYYLGIILGVTMFAAAYIGAKTVTKLDDLWLRRIFISAVILLAIKTVWDLIG